MLSRRTLPLIVVLFAVCLVYANSFANSFHFDDFHTIVDNPAIRPPVDLRRILTDATAFSVLPANQTYRPVVTASLALDYALGHGYALFWFHLSTLLWFLLLIALLYSLVHLLLNRVQRSATNSWIALGVAAWFGFHPAMAETVNYIIQRGDVFCTVGCVAALFCYARFPRLRRYGLYLLPLAFGLLSKPPAAVFPVLLLLYVFFFEANGLRAAKRWQTALGAAIPSVIATAALLWLQAARTPKSFLPSTLSPWDYRLTQPFVWMRYCGALFLPLHLNVDTDLRAFSSLTGQAIAGLLFVVGLLAIVTYAAPRRRLSPVAFGLLWFLVTQLPTSLYPLSEVENDHRMFFSFPGLMLAVVWLLYLGYDRLRREVAQRAPGRVRQLQYAACSAAVLCLAGDAWGAHRRNQVWRSEDTLWADDVQKSPHNGRGLMIYGLTRMNAGHLHEALTLFQRAQQETPNYPTLEINLGVVNGSLAQRGRPELNAVAEAHFQRAIALAPGDDTTHAYYGRWLLLQQRVAEATLQLQRAVALNPQRAMQRDLLIQAYAQQGNRSAAIQLAGETLANIPGDAYALAVLHGDVSAGMPSPAHALIDASLAAYRAGRYQDSIAKAKEALAQDPQSAEAWNNVAAGYGALRQWGPAVAAAQQAIAHNPDLPIAQNNLRWFLGQQAASQASRAAHGAPTETAASYIDRSLLLSRQGRYEESTAAVREALRLDPASAVAWNNLAANAAALGRWDEAIDAAANAIALEPHFQLARNNLAWALGQRSASGKP